MGQLGKSTLRLGALGIHKRARHGGVSTCRGAHRQPGFHRRRLHHRTGTGRAQFFRQRDRLGLLIPLLIFFLGPQLQNYLPRGSPADESWLGLANAVWRFIVRPIAVGGMMVGTCYTLFRMRKNLIAGLGKAFAELRGGAPSRNRWAAPSAT